MTTKTNASKIRTLRTEAAQFGDLRLEAVCVLALGGPPALEGAELGTEQALLLEEGMSQGEAVERCLEVLAAAAAAVPDAIAVGDRVESVAEGDDADAGRVLAIGVGGRYLIGWDTCVRTTVGADEIRAER